MILNVSGRTDIVAFYSTWFLNRYQEGFLDVRNPFYPEQVSRIDFNDVDAIIFCTKNPIPILDKINKIKKPFLFHITLTPYKKDIEPNVPNKKKIIEAIKQLSNQIGKDRIYIRYDPIFLNTQYNLEYHIRAFTKLCTELNGYTKHIIISFLDEHYQNVKRHLSDLERVELTEEHYRQIGTNFSRIAKENNMTVQTCCEEHNLIEYGLIKEDCLSSTLAYQLTGKTTFKKWTARKDKNCGCMEMVDIGVYNTCQHFCKYCYANYDENKVKNNIQHHNESGSLLIGNLKEFDTIKKRKP